MSAAAKSLFAFGIYAVVAGATLIIVPNLLITTLGFPPARDGWVRVVGALALFVGTYHIVCARNELLAYIRATVCTTGLRRRPRAARHYVSDASATAALCGDRRRGRAVDRRFVTPRLIPLAVAADGDLELLR